VGPDQFPAMTQTREYWPSVDGAQLVVLAVGRQGARLSPGMRRRRSALSVAGFLATWPVSQCECWPAEPASVVVVAQQAGRVAVGSQAPVRSALGSAWRTVGPAAMELPDLDLGSPSLIAEAHLMIVVPLQPGYAANPAVYQPSECRTASWDPWILSAELVYSHHGPSCCQPRLRTAPTRVSTPWSGRSSS